MKGSIFSVLYERLLNETLVLIFGHRDFILQVLILGLRTF